MTAQRINELIEVQNEKINKLLEGGANMSDPQILAAEREIERLNGLTSSDYNDEPDEQQDIVIM